MKYPMVFLFCNFIFACTHHDKQFENELKNKNCSKALNLVPQNQWSAKAQEKTFTSLRQVAAYSYIGANYTAEVLLDIASGAVTFVGLCAPVWMLASRSSTPASSSAAGNTCGLLMSKMYVPAPPLGRNSVQTTKDWSCPNIAPLALSLDKVVNCFRDTPTTPNLKAALATLESLEASRDYFTCLTPEQQTELLLKKKDIEAQLSQLPTHSN